MIVSYQVRHTLTAEMISDSGRMCSESRREVEKCEERWKELDAAMVALIVAIVTCLSCDESAIHMIKHSQQPPFHCRFALKSCVLCPAFVSSAHLRRLSNIDSCHAIQLLFLRFARMFDGDFGE